MRQAETGRADAIRLVALGLAIALGLALHCAPAQVDRADSAAPVVAATGTG